MEGFEHLQRVVGFAEQLAEGSDQHMGVAGAQSRRPGVVGDFLC